MSAAACLILAELGVMSTGAADTAGGGATTDDFDFLFCDFAHFSISYRKQLHYNSHYGTMKFKHTMY